MTWIHMDLHAHFTKVHLKCVGWRDYEDYERVPSLLPVQIESNSLKCTNVI